MRALYLPLMPLMLLALSSPAAAQSRVLEPDLIWETPSSLREKGFQVQDLGEIPPLLTIDGMTTRRVYRAYSRDMEQIIDCLVWGRGDAHRCWIAESSARGRSAQVFSASHHPGGVAGHAATAGPR